MAAWLITGASSGIGHGIARAALARGEQVAVTARDTARLQDLVEAYPDHVLALRVDLADHASMVEAVRACEERFGGIDVLVNNAGHGYRATVEEGEEAGIREVYAANLFGPVELMRLVLPGMRTRRHGTIVNLSSIGAARGSLGSGYYGSAKAALELVSESLAAEVAHLGIRVMIVEPGAFRTAFYDERLGATEHPIADYDVLATRYRKGSFELRHDQPGDPDAGGEVIVRTVLGEVGPAGSTPGPDDALPMRLLLGSDAVRVVEGALEKRLAELHAWASVSAASDYAHER